VVLQHPARDLAVVGLPRVDELERPQAGDEQRETHQRDHRQLVPLAEHPEPAGARGAGWIEHRANLPRCPRRGSSGPSELGYDGRVPRFPGLSAPTQALPASILDKLKRRASASSGPVIP